MPRWFFFFLVPCLAQAATAKLDDADRKFAARQYQEALKIYTTLNSESDEETRGKARFRVVESQALLFRYGEAASEVFSRELPSDEPWRSRTQLLRTQIARAYLSQYGHNLPADATLGATDPAKWTESQWQARIDEAFLDLWNRREALLRRNLADESYFVETKERDLDTVPTLWDLVAHEWTDHLLNERDRRPGLAKPPAEVFLDDSFRANVSAQGAAALVAGAIYEESARLEGKGRELAREQARAARYLLPLTHPGLVQTLGSRKDAVRSLQKLLASLQQTSVRAQVAWQLASLFNTDEKYAEAIATCDGIANSSPATADSQACAQLTSQIRTPEVSLQFADAAPGSQHGISVRARNTREVFVRLYPTTLEALRADSGPEGDWSFLRRVNERALRKMLVNRATIQLSLKIDEPAPYARVTRELELPKLAAGLYLAVASNRESFDGKDAVVEGGLVNVTDLMLFGDISREANRPSTFHVYAFDGSTGAPARNVTVEAVQRETWNHVIRKSLKAGEDGQLSVPALDSKSYGANLDPLAIRGDHHAFWASPIFTYDSKSPSHTIYLDTDRAIYRPGQTVKGKITVVTRGTKRKVATGEVKLVARDAAGQTIHQVTLKTGALGSAAFSFAIPKGRLLGSYSLSAELAQAGEVTATQSFSVEEYQRPSFEVELDSGTRPLKYGKAARAEGHARYYFGGPVAQAPYTFRVYREPILPEFCWWWRWRKPGNREEIAHGEGTTNDDGAFAIDFTPEAEDPLDKDPLPARFTVEVEARDNGGHTIAGKRVYLAGRSSLLYTVTPATRFFFAQETPKVALDAVTLDGESVATTVDYRVYRVATTTADGSGLNGKSLEELYRDAADGERVAGGKAKLNPAKKTEVVLPPLPAGVYRLRLEGDDGFGGDVKQTVILTSLGSVRDPGIDPPTVTLADRDVYRPGERAKILVGSPKLTAGGWWQIWRGDTLLATKQLGPGLQLLTLPITADDQGGLSLRWFGVAEHRAYGGTVALEVPWVTPALKLTVEGPRKVLPGAKATWKIDAKDSAGKPVDGEITLRVYDRSLEALAAAPQAWGKDLYARNQAPPGLEASLGERGATGLKYPAPGYEYRPLRVRALPGIRVKNSRRTRGHMYAMAMADAEVAEAPLADAKSSKRSEEAAPLAPNEKGLRSNFAETAVFEPQLKLVKGKATFSATMPDSLTSWTVAAQALTADVKWAISRGELATRKDLMVRLEIPRFLREGDNVRLQALVDNDSGKALSGTVALTHNGKPESKTFQVESGGQAALSWELKAPEGTGELKVKAVATAGGFSDAEERELSLLPGWQRLIASHVISLDGKTKGELNVALPSDAQTDRAVLQIDPQLALSVLAALPGLLRDPQDSVQAVIDRYVPLAITDAVFRKYPTLAAAVRKIPKRSTRVAAWEKDDARRQIQLLESPWADAAAPQSEPYLDLLDPAGVEKQRAIALEKLKARQLPSGAFSWFPQGRDDLYFTLYVLHGFAEAARYGVMPPPFVERALGYLPGALKEHLRPESGSLSLALYAAYTVTALGTPASRALHDTVRGWLEYALTQPDALTPFGKAYAANSYRALGETKKAEELLDQALDGAREDALIGVYWTPEKQSWLWYEDSVEKHAFFVQTLARLRPQDKRLPGMLKWLLFNRKATQWKSPKASAAAIYGILDFLSARGALEKGDTFRWTWNGEHGQVKVAADSFRETPPRYVREQSALKKDFAHATIDKEGPGLAFASLSAVYRTRQAQASGEGPLNVTRAFYRRVRDGDKFTLEPIGDGSKLRVGEEVEVELAVRSKAPVEYAYLASPRGAGFEPQSTASGWSWNGLARYEEPRDSLERFFLPRVPTGEYVVRYRLRATHAGNFTLGAAQLQSLYAPDLAANSETIGVTVVPK